MKKYLLTACLPLIAFFMLTVAFSTRAIAFDPFRVNNDQTVCSQTAPDATTGTANQSVVCAPQAADPLTGKNGVITKIADILAVITGVFAIVIILVSGFEYVRSGGESAKINKAKNGILFAIVGLVVVALARAIVALAVGKL